MANFGIAEELVVETESLSTGERTRSSARRDTLSTTEDTIALTSLPSTGVPGTTVVAIIPATEAIDVTMGENYITDFVAFIDIPVTVNTRQVSLHEISEAVPAIGTPIASLQQYNLSSDFVSDLTLQELATVRFGFGARISRTEVRM